MAGQPALRCKKARRNLQRQRHSCRSNLKLYWQRHWKHVRQARCCNLKGCRGVAKRASSPNHSVRVRVCRVRNDEGMRPDAAAAQLLHVWSLGDGVRRHVACRRKRSLLQPEPSCRISAT